MAKTKLELVPVTDSDDWDAYVRESQQGTLFSEKFYLQACGRKHDLFRIIQGTEHKACVALVTSDCGEVCELDDLVIYGGILFNLDQNRPVSKRMHDEFQISEFMANKIASKYTSIDFQLAPQFYDMRPFLWHEYGGPKELQFSIDLRYTSYLDISGLADYKDREEESPFFKNMETVRRYSVRDARRKGGRTEKVNDGHTFVEYYSSLMARQGEIQDQEKLVRMKNVINALIENDRGVVFHVYDSEGVVLYSVIYGWDDKRAYYLFGAGHPEVSTPWQGTLAHWDMFKYLSQERGIGMVDLEGVNSPQRGWFKLGFGGYLVPYYEVRR